MSTENRSDIILSRGFYYNGNGTNYIDVLIHYGV